MSPYQPSESLRHPIGVVARRTGLKPDLIRAWERRYGAVEPGRSGTRRRLYSDADIARLLLLKRAVATGRSIGQIADLPNETLESLIAADRPGPDGSAEPPPFAAPDHREAPLDAFLDACLAAARRLDGTELERQLELASVALSRAVLLERLLVPLLDRVGELWRQGDLRPSHEHVASAVVRSFLGGMRLSLDTLGQGPRIVATTPPRQRHELGALMAAASAAAEGWRVTYLGPDLPAEEIAAACRETGARALALSIVYPPDDPALPDELRRLRRLLPPDVAVLAGGRAAAAYTAVLAEIGARRIDDLASFRRELEELRAPVADVRVLSETP